MLCEVRRAFPGPSGIRLLKGTVVDVSGWRQRNVKALIEQGKLGPVPDPPEAEKQSGDNLWTCDECGESMTPRMKGIHRAKKHSDAKEPVA